MNTEYQFGRNVDIFPMMINNDEPWYSVPSNTDKPIVPKSCDSRITFLAEQNCSIWAI